MEELADRAEGYLRPDGKVFESLVPLPEVIAASTGKSAAGVRVQRMYQEMIRRLGDEFSILRNVPAEDIRLTAGTMIAEGIGRLRRGEVKRKPGFDGEYGTIQLFEPWELDNVDGQISLALPSQDIVIEEIPTEIFHKAETPDASVTEAAASKEPEGIIIERHDLPGEIFLNENQKEAVTVLARAVSVKAGPGTGKTGTLTARILHLLKERGVKPSEITAVTFTNKAAAELRQRLEKQTGGKKTVRLLNIGTFHSICLEILKENDFEVEVVGNGDDALKLLQSRIYDLCILDIGLPDCSGFLLCKKIRQFYRNPIIIFTAYENEEDIVTGLMAGADDYVTKPCSLRVLRSRIFSQLRRKQWSEEIETEIIRSGDLVIDVVHNMIFKKGRELSIKDTEFRLCYMLVRNDGRIMPRELLLERLWDMDEHFIENNTLSVYVSRLRKKLGVYNGVSYIETIKGIGYRWNHLVQRGEFNE